MKRWLFFLYGAGGYLGFLATYAYLAGFVGNFLVPVTIDSTIETAASGAVINGAAASGRVGQSVVIDLLLLGLFAVQHSVMARPAFKRVWTRIVPQPIERSTYVWLSCVVTIVLMWQWRGIGPVVWDVQSQPGRAALWGLFAVGWMLVPFVSLLIDHFDLFGMRQVWQYLNGREGESLPFRVPILYRNVRHPLYIGWAIAFWATPTMSAGHLLFAAVMTGYMGLAALVEERDLLAHFGQQYADYRRRVPMFIPRLSSEASSSPSAEKREPVMQEAEARSE